MSSNHHTRKAVANRERVEFTEYAGLMPDPEALKKLEEIIPNVGERWMSIAESEIASRQKNDRTIVTTYRNATYFGNASALFVSILILALAFYLFYKDQFVAGCTLVGSSLVTNVIAWIARDKNPR
jgi:uncharacterized membrane protein